MVKKSKEELKYDDMVLINDKILDLDEKFQKTMMELESTSIEYIPEEDLAKKKVLPISSIKSQGKIGSCTAFMAAAALETLIEIHTEETDDLSETFSYMNNKNKDQFRGNYYSGSSSSVAARLIRDDGICHESLRPYIQKEVVTLTRLMYLDAKKRKAKAIHYLANNVYEMKNALSQNMPIAFSIKVFSEFYKGGWIKKLGSRRRSGHALLIYGYEDKSDGTYFYVKNSWGKSYGSTKGVCYIRSDVLFRVIKTNIAIEGLVEPYAHGPLSEYPDPSNPGKTLKRRWKWYYALAPWKWFGGYS